MKKRGAPLPEILRFTPPSKTSESDTRSDRMTVPVYFHPFSPYASLACFSEIKPFSRSSKTFSLSL
ncbi:MAG: hypothetical protein Q7R34_04420, partial [Dehalococcoidia bacterium]|nr:hypothetical protein [Dehalococcoidia bacterium]